MLRNLRISKLFLFGTFNELVQMFIIETCVLVVIVVSSGIVLFKLIKKDIQDKKKIDNEIIKLKKNINKFNSINENIKSCTDDLININKKLNICNEKLLNNITLNKN